ncbi:MAG TPA: hypothetical protein VM783_17920 [Candidatus Acidoferrum sp.]|nr:hypothetical protein [Candidatus Acidoferrum sp.]
MSQVLANLLALANEEAENSVDMNVAQKGGGGARLLPEGYAFGRVVKYIEYGNHDNSYAGESKGAAPFYSLGFALWGQGYQNDDGTPYIVDTYPRALSLNEKANAYKLFKALNWKGTATHFAQLLGQPYLVKIKHEPRSKADQTIVSRIDMAGFLPPLDPVSKQPYPIPEATDDLYKLFLWERPTKAAWDSLFIEGMWEAKEGKPAESKNKIQEMILSALNYQGSPLQLLLGGAVAALPTAAPASPVAAPPPVAAPAVAPAPIAAPTAPMAAPTVPFDPTPPGQPQLVAAPTAPVMAAVPATAPAPVAVPVAVAAVPVPITSPALPA